MRQLQMEVSRLPFCQSTPSTISSQPAFRQRVMKTRYIGCHYQQRDVDMKSFARCYFGQSYVFRCVSIAKFDSCFDYSIVLVGWGMLLSVESNIVVAFSGIEISEGNFQVYRSCRKKNRTLNRTKQKKKFLNHKCMNSKDRTYFYLLNTGTVG